MTSRRAPRLRSRSVAVIVTLWVPRRQLRQRDHLGLERVGTQADYMEPEALANRP